jgi:hypothetical protein
MKKIPLIELHWDGLKYHRYYNEYFKKWMYASYVYWWNWLPKENRYLGYEMMYYDGEHHSFGFWFFNWSWGPN